MNADLNVIGKCAVIADHKSQGKTFFLKILVNFDKKTLETLELVLIIFIISMLKSKVVFYFIVYFF